MTKKKTTLSVSLDPNMQEKESETTPKKQRMSKKTTSQKSDEQSKDKLSSVLIKNSSEKTEKKSGEKIKRKAPAKRKKTVKDQQTEMTLVSPTETEDKSPTRRSKKTAEKSDLEKTSSSKKSSKLPKSSNSLKSSKKTEQTGLTEPAELIKSTKLKKTANLTNSSNSTKSTKSTKSTNPTKPTNSTKSTKPTKSTKSTKSTKETETKKTVKKTKTVRTKKKANSDNISQLTESIPSNTDKDTAPALKSKEYQEWVFKKSILESRRKFHVPTEAELVYGAERLPVWEPGWIVLKGISHNNLKSIDVPFPLSAFTAVTGVSGSGKSSLVEDVLFRELAHRFHRAQEKPGTFQSIYGHERLNKVIRVDQSPIGQTPTSNPATYTGVFELIRQLFAQLPESRLRGYSPRRFSFNVSGGRCEKCEGAGQIKIEMHFLADVWITCDACDGKRYDRQTLDVKYRGHSISDVLDMSCVDALQLFRDIPNIRRILKTLCDVGLDYIALGQSAPTLSGGEAQRVKLAAELARPDTGKTLYLLDEPTTGLHFNDLKKLLRVLQQLVDLGNTVVVIEHNLDVIKSVDWIVDIGPEAGLNGGQLVFAGTPEELAEYGRIWLKNHPGKTAVSAQPLKITEEQTADNISKDETENKLNKTDKKTDKKTSVKTSAKILKKTVGMTTEKTSEDENKSSKDSAAGSPSKTASTISDSVKFVSGVFRDQSIFDENCLRSYTAEALIPVLESGTYAERPVYDPGAEIAKNLSENINSANINSANTSSNNIKGGDSQRQYFNGQNPNNQNPNELNPNRQNFGSQKELLKQNGMSDTAASHLNDRKILSMPEIFTAEKNFLNHLSEEEKQSLFDLFKSSRISRELLQYEQSGQTPYSSIRKLDDLSGRLNLNALFYLMNALQKENASLIAGSAPANSISANSISADSISADSISANSEQAAFASINSTADSNSAIRSFDIPESAAQTFLNPTFSVQTASNQPIQFHNESLPSEKLLQTKTNEFSDFAQIPYLSNPNDLTSFQIDEQDAQMPWEINGRQWHTGEHPSRNGAICKWDGKILAEIVDRIQERSCFADVDWNHRSVVEIRSSKKSLGWFFHAITAEEWLLKLKFRTKRNTFNKDELVPSLNLRPLNEIDDIPLYGTQMRTQLEISGLWQEIELRVYSFEEINRPEFWTFLKTAIDRFEEFTEIVRETPSDLTPWKKQGSNWHFTTQGFFGGGTRPIWKMSLLEEMLTLLKEIAPDVQMNEGAKTMILLNLPKRSLKPWAILFTKNTQYLGLQLNVPKNKFPLGQILNIGFEPEVDGKKSEFDALQLKFRTSEELTHPDFLRLLTDSLDF